LADELAITVTNVPSKRADWKPVVECGFKLQRRALEDGIPGFDPPENAKRRQGKKYDRDACLTLSQFTTIILNSIIAHNRAPMQHYDLSLKELGDGVVPSPIALWNHGIAERAGLLTRYDEDRVRMALLPRAEATVTEEGILINGCHYTCQAALDGGWFVQARRKRFKLVAIFDSRMVDIAYVQNPYRRDETHSCTLTARSAKYRGLSVREVEGIQKLERRLQPDIEQGRHQATADMNRRNDAVAAAAKTRLAKLGRIPARTSRRADTKEARTEELRNERQSTLASLMPGKVPSDGSLGEVVALHRRREASKPEALEATPASAHGEDVDATADGQAVETMSQRLQRMREQMRGG
jgi:putative transposase